jgi:hypothetical protein
VVPGSSPGGTTSKLKALEDISSFAFYFLSTILSPVFFLNFKSAFFEPLFELSLKPIKSMDTRVLKGYLSATP